MGIVQDAIARELPYLRAEAEGRMGAENGSSTGNLMRSTGRTTQNESTGREEPAWDTVHQDLPGRLSRSSTASASKSNDVPGGTEQVATMTLNLPAATEDVRDGDLYDITAGQWSGRTFRIIEATAADQATALRVPVVEVQRPEEW